MGWHGMMRCGHVIYIYVYGCVLGAGSSHLTRGHVLFIPCHDMGWDGPCLVAYHVITTHVGSGLNAHQLHRLHMILKPFMLRRVKKDVEHEMPTKTEVSMRIIGCHAVGCHVVSCHVMSSCHVVT